MENQTVVTWMFVHPWMTFFIGLTLAESIPYLFGKQKVIIEHKKD